MFYLSFKIKKYMQLNQVHRINFFFIDTYKYSTIQKIIFFYIKKNFVMLISKKTLKKKYFIIIRSLLLILPNCVTNPIIEKLKKFIEFSVI